MLTVLRVSHSASVPAHRERDRALVRAGVRLTLVLPATWSETGAETGPAHPVDPADEGLDMHRLDVVRPGDINRHRYSDTDRIDALVGHVRPDLIDLHEEPFSTVARQWVAIARRHAVPVVMYTAQNIDKRFPPPFAQYESEALAAAAAVYPCSRQAASVVRGKGFVGTIDVLPLGYDPSVFVPGRQSVADQEVLLGLVGRLVPEKGVVDAVQVLAAVNAVRPARLVLIGSGPELESARRRAAELDVADRVEVVPWIAPDGLAQWYRRMHVVLIPSRTTARWVEQFGRVIVEGNASGAVVAGYASGAIPEVAGEAGVLVPEGDLAGLCAAVSEVLTSGDYDRRRASGLAEARGLTWAAVAERQVGFYAKTVADESARPVDLPRRCRATSQTRARARLEFGPSASVLGQERPFALPVLRSSPQLGRVLGQVLDGMSRR